MSTPSPNILENTFSSHTSLEDLYLTLSQALFSKELERRFESAEWFVFVENHPEFATLLADNLLILFPGKDDRYNYASRIFSSDSPNLGLLKALLLTNDYDTLMAMDEVALKLNFPKDLCDLLLDPEDNRIFEIIGNYVSGDLSCYCGEREECILKMFDKVARKSDTELTGNFLAPILKREIDKHAGAENNQLIINLLQRADEY